MKTDNTYSRHRIIKIRCHFLTAFWAPFNDTSVKFQLFVYLFDRKCERAAILKTFWSLLGKFASFESITTEHHKRQGLIHKTPEPEIPHQR